MSETWVNLAVVDNGTSSTSIRLIAPERWLLKRAFNSPYVTLYPHQIVISGFVRIYRIDTEQEVPPQK